jgi:hypothetical protein
MDAFAVSLAVVAGKGNRETKVFDLNYGLFHGTAFCLAPHLFLGSTRITVGLGRHLGVAAAGTRR